MKITFLLIVFNGDDYLHASIASYYKHADQILIVEGAVKEFWQLANENGGSTDDTWNILNNFSDPENKITILRGKWLNKEEMTNALLAQCTGDYVMRVDSDEILDAIDMLGFREYLKLKKPEGLSVTMTEFFGSYDYELVPESGHAIEYLRIWKYKPGAIFSGHRPPRLELKGRKWPRDEDVITSSNFNQNRYFKLFHYSYMKEKQIIDKIKYYKVIYYIEFGIGIPFFNRLKDTFILGYLIRKFAQIRLFWPLRKKISSVKFEEDFLDKVWRPWHQNRTEIEKNFSLNPNQKVRYFTKKYIDNHPMKVLQRYEK